MHNATSRILSYQKQIFTGIAHSHTCILGFVGKTNLLVPQYTCTVRIKMKVFRTMHIQEWYQKHKKKRNRTQVGNQMRSRFMKLQENHIQF